ncbi:ATP-binding protein, IstB-like protein [Thermacetogenium phaeum DSM 12270]|uniref:ATP-binding protein, IstB-like protein n=1 Tax=Thermacetogenium phaeum (strain ATCC BAA-254 / DSM 26808 / PB) TaxID=1089553 RepID=K4LKN0_THEPS|nr:IS21-like element helper ATPase IstB [Thermacetogenium phaeum]AFV12525.1 ATP-binding protein, IstB-like protein [Thermacetogenium phaeum DSM 12270]
MSEINPVKETIRLYAKQLRTPTFSRYENVIRQLAPSDGYDQFLCQLMKQELNQRQETSQRRRIKKAGFPITKSLDEFEFSRLEHVSEAFVRELSSCDFINNRQNVVMIGNPGSGKTHLAIGLGMKACYAGFNVKFYTAVNLANELAEAIEFRRLSKLEKSLAKIDLLIIDELSYLTFNRHQSEMLFQVISDRSERASVIITTNLEFSRWTELFENEIMVAALIDRVTFRSFILNMNVQESYRLEQTISKMKQGQ